MKFRNAMPRIVGMLAFAPLLALPVAFNPAQAQPKVTHNTDVFQYWTLNGEALKDHLPPLADFLGPATECLPYRSASNLIQINEGAAVSDMPNGTPQG
jgi:hypothetical protein